MTRRGVTVTFTSNASKAIQAIDKAAMQRMLQATNEVRNEALNTLSGPRTGRTYRVPGTNRTYTASAPGEPPAQRLGRLRTSVKTSIVDKGKDLEGQVGSGLEYAPMLEHGTRRMAARPWLKPSFEKALGRVKDILGGRWL